MDATDRETDLRKKIAAVRQLKSDIALMKLMHGYDWNEGFEIPLTVITHRRCDLGLALFLFWRRHEVQQYYREKVHIGDDYQLAFCKTLINGLLKGAYQPGNNKYDTGCYGAHLAPEGSAVHELRALRTQRAQEHYPDPFLQPVL